MKKVLLKVLVFALAAVLTLSCFASCGKSGGDELIIGLSGPLTGGAALYGVAVNNSVEMAVEEINAAGGLKNGVKLKAIMLDDAHDKEKAAANYASLVDQGMQVSLGCVTTAPCLEFANYAKEDNVFFITPSATGDDVTKYDNAFQMCFSDSSQGTAAAKYVKEEVLSKGVKVGVLYLADDPYSKGIFDTFSAAFSSSELSQMTIQSFTSDSQSDLSPQAQKFANDGCTFIFMPTYTEAAANFLTAAKNVLDPKAVVYGCDGFDGIDNVEGFDIASVPQEVSYLSHFNSASKEGLSGEFVRKYTEKYGIDTLSQFGAGAYDCVYALVDALNEEIDAGKTIDGNTSASELCELLKAKFSGGFTFTGVTGHDMTWNKDGRVNKDAVKYIVKAAD